MSTEILQQEKTPKQTALMMQPNYFCLYDYYPNGQTAEKSLETNKINFVDTFHDCEVSAAATKTLKKSVQYISYLSKMRHYEELRKNKKRKESCTGYAKNDISRRADEIERKRKSNFLCAFITLTLPAAQKHTDKELTEGLINPFFVYARKYFGIKYYCWKKELQEVAPEGREYGNLHFHIIVDHFVEWHYLRREWNRLLNRGKVSGIVTPFTYIDDYKRNQQQKYINGFDELKQLKECQTSKFILSEMDKIFKEYQEQHEGNFMPQNEYDAKFTELVKKEFEQRKKNYNEQMSKPASERWTNPNSTDIKAVRSSKEIAAYCAKYIVKDITLNNPNLAKYCNEVFDIKSRLFSYLVDATKKENQSPDAQAEILDTIEKIKKELADKRKQCPIQGRLWFKSNSLTPFLSGAKTLIDNSLNTEVAAVLQVLRAKKKKLVIEPTPDEYKKDKDGNFILDKNGQKILVSHGKKVLTALITPQELFRMNAKTLFYLFDCFVKNVCKFNDISEQLDKLDKENKYLFSQYDKTQLQSTYEKIVKLDAKRAPLVKAKNELNNLITKQI